MKDRNNINEVIPIFRSIINNITGIPLDKIISVNSYFKSDLSLIKDNGTFINGNVDELLLFDINSLKIDFTDQQKDKLVTLYNCEFVIDLYGDNSNSQGLQLITQILSSKSLEIFNRYNIGINPIIEFTNQNEQINEKTWSRSHIVINFTYEYIENDIQDKIIDIDFDLQIRKE